jgi:hypothetical protein
VEYSNDEWEKKEGDIFIHLPFHSKHGKYQQEKETTHNKYKHSRKYIL